MFLSNQSDILITWNNRQLTRIYHYLPEMCRFFQAFNNISALLTDGFCEALLRMNKEMDNN